MHEANVIDPNGQVIIGLESWVSRYLVMTRAEREWWRRYNRYLNSEGWALTREACLRRDGYHCRQCGFTGGPGNPLKAHHLTFDNYNRTGRTPVSDLQTLCRQCLQMIASRTKESSPHHLGAVAAAMVVAANA
jgi:5-methylcytosine-specific restriction endonuclease McrA